MSKKNKSKAKKGQAKAVKSAKQKAKAKSTYAGKKKKKWFRIIAPKEFNDMCIGETFASEPREMIGRVVRVDLMALGSDQRRQGVSVSFRVISANDKDAICKTVGYKISGSNVRRIVRKGADKMDNSFLAETKNGGKFKIKSVISTRFRVNASVISALRKRSAEFISEKIKDIDTSDLFLSVIRGNLQKDIKADVRKICPIGACEIRALELVA